MNLEQFKKIKEFFSMEEIKGEPGEFFLFGESMIEQKYNKLPGDEATVYVIIRESENSLLYVPKIIKIEKGD